MSQTFQTLRIVGGDYDFDENPDLLKKLILRRLITSPGSFFHLPNYGLGLQVKRPFSIQDLPVLKAQIEEQVKLEPEVDTVTSSLTMTNTGVLQILLQVTTKPIPEHIEVSLAVPLAGSKG